MFERSVRAPIKKSVTVRNQRVRCKASTWHIFALSPTYMQWSSFGQNSPQPKRQSLQQKGEGAEIIGIEAYVIMYYTQERLLYLPFLCTFDSIIMNMRLLMSHHTIAKTARFDMLVYVYTNVGLALLIHLEDIYILTLGQVLSEFDKRVFHDHLEQAET